jgi:hypothetical protein
VREALQQWQWSCTGHARQTGGTRRRWTARLGQLWRAARWRQQRWGGEVWRRRSAVRMRIGPHQTCELGRRLQWCNKPGTAPLVAMLRYSAWTSGRPERRLERQLLGGPDGIGSLERPSTGGGATSTRRWRDDSGPSWSGLRLPGTAADMAA